MLRAIPLLFLLAACNADGTVNKQRVIDVTCDTDAALQPTVLQVVISPVPGAVAVDDLLVHPAVVGACAAFHSKPTAAKAAAP